MKSRATKNIKQKAQASTKAAPKKAVPKKAAPKKLRAGLKPNPSARKPLIKPKSMSAADYKALFDNSGSGMLVFEPENDGKGFRLAAMNRRASAMGAVNAHEILGKRAEKALPGLKDSALLDAIGRVWRTGVPEHLPQFYYRDSRASGWLRCSVYSLPSGAVVADCLDLTPRKLSEDSLRWELSLNRALGAMLASLIDKSLALEDVAKLTLEYAKGLTDSAHGYVATIEPESGDLVCHTLSAMLDECRVKDPYRQTVLKRGPEGRYPALLGHALNTREPFFTNSPSSHPASAGTPRGHIPVGRFLSVPAVIGGVLVGQVSLANSTRDYTDRDLSVIERLAELFSIAIARVRAMDEIRKSHEELEAKVRQRTAGLREANEQLKREIAERSRAEDALRMSEARYKGLSLQFHTLLDAIPDALLLVDADLKIIWANRGASRTAGRNDSLEGLVCGEVSAYCPGDDSRCLCRRGFASGEVSEERIVAPDRRVFDVRVFPIKDEDGGVVSVLEIVSEVTEEVRRERETVRTSQLASLGEMAAGVAHEINNPINGIINYAQLLLGSKDASERDREICRRIIREGDRIAYIVTSLLSFARDRREDRRLCSIEDIVADTVVLIEALLRKDGISLRLRFEPGLPMVHAQPDQLRQVLLNLITNARHALNQRYAGTHEGKVLEIHASALNDTELGPVLQVSVTDYGTGIPRPLIDRVMNPFFTTKAGSGTGLGLSISHGIITDHGGRISIESEEGRFTSVKVTIPAAISVVNTGGNAPLED